MSSKTLKHDIFWALFEVILAGLIFSLCLSFLKHESYHKELFSTIWFVIGWFSVDTVKILWGYHKGKYDKKGVVVSAD